MDSRQIRVTHENPLVVRCISAACQANQIRFRGYFHQIIQFLTHGGVISACRCFYLPASLQINQRPSLLGISYPPLDTSETSWIDCSEAFYKSKTSFVLIGIQPGAFNFFKLLAFKLGP